MVDAPSPAPTGTARAPGRTSAQLCGGGKFRQHPKDLRRGQEEFCRLVPAPAPACPPPSPQIVGLYITACAGGAATADRKPNFVATIERRLSALGGAIPSAARRWTEAIGISPLCWPVSATRTLSRQSRKRPCCPRMSLP